MTHARSGLQPASVSLSNSAHWAKAMKIWQQVQKQLKQKPITEGMIGGAAPLYVERYLFKSISRSVSGLNGIALVTQLGGSRVQEGRQGHMPRRSR